jgi:hypothetical protein
METLKNRQLGMFKAMGLSCSIRIVDSQFTKLFLDDDEGVRKRQRTTATMAMTTNRHSKPLVKYFNDIESDGIILFPIHDSDHWSLLSYCVATRTWFYTDSYRNYHKSIVARLVVKISEVIPNVGTMVMDVNTYHDQVGKWECGQYMVIFAGIIMDCAHQLRMGDVSDLMVMVENLTSEASKRTRIMNFILHLLQ